MAPNGSNGHGKTNGKGNGGNGRPAPTHSPMQERWAGVTRPYSPADVERLAGSIHVEHTLARLGAEKLWRLMHTEPYVNALGALTGHQAVQQVAAGLKAIYASGWQVAGDANDAGQVYPDQSLYPADSVPHLVKRINNALTRADQIQHSEGRNEVDWFAPIVADAEAGFGGNLNAFELMKAMIEAGAAGVHFEDQLSSAKKCGHLGGKVLVPTGEFIQKLVAARLASDVMGVPTVLIARTDADSAQLITSNNDPRDHEFLTGERTVEGFFRIQGASPQDKPVKLHFASGDVRKSWAESGETEIIALLAWADIRMYLRDVDLDNRVATLSGHPRPSNKEANARYFIENAPDSLDAPGEWQLDRQRGVVRYRRRGGEGAGGQDRQGSR